MMLAARFCRAGAMRIIRQQTCLGVDRMLRTGLAVTLLFWLTACAVNPVTGERGLNFYGEDWELEVGEQQYAPMRQSQGGDFVLDAGLVDYVQSVGQRVASEADRTLPYEFHVINSSVPNAWALPAGKIVVNRGLLTELGSEAELAAVLGHEVTHAAASHRSEERRVGRGCSASR